LKFVISCHSFCGYAPYYYNAPNWVSSRIPRDFFDLYQFNGILSIICNKPNQYAKANILNRDLTNYGQNAYLWIFLKLLGYQLSHLFVDTLKEKFNEKKKKLVDSWLVEKMCFSCVYYSRFGCCDSWIGYESTIC
jgi:hypothetical protein